MPEVNLDREDLVSSKENPLLCPSAPWRNGVSLLHQDIVEHQESRTQDIVAVVTTLWILAYIAVGARVLGRFVGRTKLWWDDWIIFLAAAILAPTLTTGLIQSHLGAGKHEQILVQDHPENIHLFLKTIYVGEILYPLVIVCVKCSILALYYRIFGIKRKIARIYQVLMGTTVAWGIATSLSAAFQCRHIDAAWDRTGQRHCYNPRAYLIGTNVPNIFLDVAVLITPLYSVWQLKMSTTRKLLISGIFALGACETAFSIGRLASLFLIDNSDVTWTYFPAIVWSAVEMCVGMMWSYRMAK